MSKTEIGTNGIGGNGSAGDNVGDDGIATIDPTAIGSGGNGNGSSGSGTTAKPKRARAPAKRTTARSKKQVKNSGSIVGVEKILLSIHMMASSALKIEELALDESEAEALATGIKDVASHYDIAPDPKMLAWVGLIGTVSAIYAPRVMAYKMRKATEKKEQRVIENPEPTQADPSEPFVEVFPTSNVS